MTNLSDEKIIELYFDRNEQAIEESSAKYGAYCSKVAFNILADAQISEECVNDTWFNAWNTIPPQRPSILRAFFAKITRNLAINRYNAESAEKRGGGEVALILDELSEVASGGEDPADGAAANELGKAISDFLRSLPERERGIMLRRYFRADSVSDIAQFYNMTPGNVSVVLNRCRGKLKDYLVKEGYMI